MSRQQLVNYNVHAFVTEGVDTDNNPEILLMRAEGDETECEIEQSFWLSGNALTHPKHYDM